MSLVYWDTMLFAYLFEDHPEFKSRVARIVVGWRSAPTLCCSGDAIHLACAAEARVDLLLTHDRRLATKIIPGIQFIATLDTNVL